MDRPSLPGLRARLLLLALLTLFPAFGFVLYTSLEQRHHAAADARKAALQLARLAALDQKQILASARQQLRMLSRLPIVQQPRRSVTCSQVFAELLRQNPYYANLGVAGRDGTLRCSAVPTDRPVNITDRDYFRVALATNDFAAGGYQIGRVTGRSSVNFGYPVRDSAGEPHSVVFLAVDLGSWLEGLVAANPLPPGTSLLVVNDQSTILARHPDPHQWVGKTLPDAPLVKTMLAQQGEGSIQETGVDGVPRLHVYMPIQVSPTHRVYVSAGIPVELVYADVERAFLGRLAALILVAALVVAAAWVAGSRLILRPVSALTSAAQRLAEGDLRARAGLAHDTGEFGQLARAFDIMAATIEQRVTQLDSAKREIRALNTDLERKVRERTAELREANKELESFSYSVSHDLRAPLRAIDGFSLAIIEDCGPQLDEQGRHHLQRVRAATQRMGELIDDLLKLARLTRAELRRETVDLSALAREVVGELLRHHPGRPPQVRIEEGLTANGDPKLLRIALANLLGNAIKFSGRQAQPEVAFGMMRDEEHGRAYYVRDNGAGFDMTHADKLFGAFQRLHAERDFPGSGIGLATVQRIVHRHGGRIWAEGVRDRGATFYFTLAT